MVKQKVIVLYGGRSTEHEISRRSATFIFKNIDQSKYEVIPVGITKEGKWCLQDTSKVFSSDDVVAPLEDRPETVSLVDLSNAVEKEAIVAFSTLHGTYGEDGCTQGLLELRSLAYVGPGVLGSAIAMDKVVAKKLLAAIDVPVVPWVDFRLDDWDLESQKIMDKINAELSYPLYVKPANLGSSVGISKVKEKAELQKAIQVALSFDEKILVESGLDVREIEFAALGGYHPKISAPGEVVAKTDFYSYESKYEDKDSSEVIIPADLPKEKAEQGRELVKTIFKELNLHGLSRIDLFLEKKTGNFYFNEANTLPGFTSISQYPLLWKHEGLSEDQLIDELIKNALDRWTKQSKLTRSYA